jgi:hypothetical protein
MTMAGGDTMAMAGGDTMTMAGGGAMTMAGDGTMTMLKPPLGVRAASRHFARFAREVPLVRLLFFGGDTMTRPEVAPWPWPGVAP